MVQEFKLNRLETTRLMGPMVDKHWKELRTAKERGEKVAWCSGVPFIFAYAMDMKCHFMAGYSAYCAGRKAGEHVLEIADSTGELPDTCSYHRMHMGMAEAVKRGIPVREDVVLPIPDLMIAGRVCPEMSHYAEALYRKFGIQVAGIELMTPYQESDYEFLEPYLERQFKEILIPTLEEICGKPFDYDHMREILRVLKKTATIRNDCLEYFKKVPSPWTLWDYGVSLAPVIYLMGKPETIPYYEKLRAELEERSKKNIPAILPEEKHRVFWDGWLPWGFLGHFSRKLTSYGANPISGRYPWEMFPRPDLIDPEGDPVHTFVKALYTGTMLGNNMAKPGLSLIDRIIPEYQIDGLIFFTAKSCRIWKSQLTILEKMERKYGIPGLCLEADMADPKMFSDAQIDTRLNAFFEVLEARKEKRRWV